MSSRIASGTVGILLFLCSSLGQAQPQPSSPDPATTEPFAFGDFTWLNGSNRHKTALLDTKYFTGSALLDANYCFSFNRPIDDTLIGSTVTGRHNELNVLMASLGGDFHYENARATLTLQMGARSVLVPRNDQSVNRGQYDLATAFRYIREAYAGYHWDVWHGVNLDAGIFMSYIGLFSYLSFENWAYQPSYVSDNTPFFFQGLRLQAFPTERLKMELWLTNGWQSYAKFNQAPGFGFQVNYRPREWVSLVANAYGGFDTANAPGRLRLHSDNSLLIRYYNAPGAAALGRAAFSLTADVGGESGDGVSFAGGSGGPAQYFLGFMLYNRFWFFQDLFGLTVGGGAITNPGRYLVLLPPGQATAIFNTTPGTTFKAWDATLTVDYMPSDFLTYRLEGVYRAAGAPYFAGRGGVTSPDGFSTTPIPPGWQPDLSKSETRLILAFLFRM